jgi:hypothetical protein
MRGAIPPPAYVFMVKVKVKSLGLTKHHVMKTYYGVVV